MVNNNLDQAEATNSAGARMPATAQARKTMNTASEGIRTTRGAAKFENVNEWCFLPMNFVGNSPDHGRCALQRARTLFPCPGLCNNNQRIPEQLWQEMHHDM